MSEDTRILIAEDDAVSRRLLESVLQKWGYDVVATTNGIEAWDVLRKEDVRLAILDWMMPGMDGVEVCRRVRMREDGNYVYLILLTALSCKDSLVRGLEAGADDYLTKPFDPHELKVHLRAGRRILDLQAALIDARERLRDKAARDPLTGLWNRSAINDILQREVMRAERYRTPLCVVMGDLDHFKRVNDTYGHMAGDAVLYNAAKRMASSLRPYDSLARYGGEEFLLVIPECNGAEGMELAERIRACIGADPIDTSEGRISITISLGVATRGAGGKTYGEALIRAADAALYRAKHRGRNRVEPATAEDMADQSKENRSDERLSNGTGGGRYPGERTPVGTPIGEGTLPTP